VRSLEQRGKTVKEDTRHLSDAQIEETASKGPGECSPSVETHLSECDVCLDRLLTSQRTQFAFLESHGMRTEAYPDCPQPEVLQEIAAQAQIPESADPVLKHTAQCDYCGPVFNRYLQEFSDDYSPEVRAMLQSLPSTQERQQKDLARKLAAQARGEKQPSKPATAVMPWPFWKKAVAWATPLAALVLVAIGVGPALMSSFELHSAKAQVKKAYEQQRTTAMQLAGMPHSQYVKPNRVLGTHDTDNDAPALLNAKGAINEHLKSGKPLDSDWLQVQGRIYLLQGSPDKAEKVLRNALASSSNAAPIMIDLAATYYERGDYAKTIDTLVGVSEDAKASESDKSTALFDLAVAYQKAEMWDMAADTWRKFLAKQSSGAWADEARERLAAAEKKLEWHKQQGQIILTDPAKFLASLGSPTVQQNAEEYINTVLTLWIPQSSQSPPNDFFFGGPKAG
jgi:tetratricopeptide (TPR) repeat protein